MLQTIRFSVLVACFASILAAQGGYAIVSGRVQDTSTAVVPGVQVSARNANTGVVVNSLSNAEGYYTFTNLVPGTYSITARRAGFKNLERTGVVLQVGDHPEIDLILEVGEATQQVTVTEQIALLRT